LKKKMSTNNIKKNKSLPVIGITMGDPVGIGPEIVIKALSSAGLFDLCRPVVIGDKAILEREIKSLNASVKLDINESVENATSSTGTISLLPASRLNPDTAAYGWPTRETGRAMGDYIVRAVALATAQKIAAVVTTPISKKSLQEAGFAFPGHTEMLARLTDTKDVVMMLVGEKLRVVLVTIHCAVSEVPKLLDQEKILKTVLITHESLKRYFSIDKPRIAVAALNPHAGEEGLFGNEERAIILPAIQQARDREVDATGPHPPETLFYQAAHGRFDAVVCMYHDQGLIPLKLLHFDDGVNVTLGLPIIRTSVGHGTAYDIAGTAAANPASLLSAIKVAVQMAQARSMRHKV
jgi:4-hydroxythreonine-4-phosphate dehydrogenase